MNTAAQRLVRLLELAASYNDKGFYWHRHTPAQVHAMQHEWQREMDTLVSELGEEQLPAGLLAALRSGAAVEDGSGTYASAARRWAGVSQPPLPEPLFTYPSYEPYRAPASTARLPWGFCILEGLALGLPVGLLLPESAHHLIPAPDWLRWSVGGCCGGAVLILPIWSMLTLHRHKGLMVVGVVTFVVLLLFLLLPAT